MFKSVESLADGLLERVLPKMTARAAGCYRCGPRCEWFCCMVGARYTWVRCCYQNCGCQCVFLASCN